MTIYECMKCGKIFKQKCHFNKHNERKNPCNKIKNTINSISKKTTSKKSEIKSLSWYHDNMRNIFNFVVEDIDPAIKRGVRHIIIKAQVKTGKRFIAQACSIYNSSISDESYVHIFISSWIRRDDDRQRKEINAYFKGTNNDTRVFKINTGKSRINCIKKLKDLVSSYDKVIVHHDELDYGSGIEQHMAAVYEYCISQEKICLISYSATYEEAIIEKSVNLSCYIRPFELEFNPPNEYRGIKWFCDNNLIHEAEPFFERNDDDDIILSEQAKKILRDTKNNLNSDIISEKRKKLIIVRINTHFKEIKELIDSEEFPELRCNEDLRILPHFVHSTDINTINVKWDDYTWWKKQMEIERGDGKFILILFIDKSSTRSTDWFCHPWLSAYHDYHPINSSVSCSGQSNPRIVYFTNKICNGIKVYNDEEFHINLYGQKDIMEYVAGIKSLDELTRPVSSRSKVFENLNTFGHVIQVQFTKEELENFNECFDNDLNNDSRILLNNLIYSKLNENEKNIIQERILKGKRTYDSNSGRGGIFSVLSKKLRNMNSGPGGGIGSIGGNVYNNRELYYWIDLALDDLEFNFEEENIMINKGTAYITYGISDPELSSDESDNESDDIDDKINYKNKYSHRKTKKSMYTNTIQT